MSKFQIILMVVFGAFIVIAVLVFSLSRNSGQSSATVTVWGDISANDFGTLLVSTGLNQDNSLNIKYAEKSSDSIDQDLTEALASGTGPDLVILPLDKFWRQRNKLMPIPYKSISESDFKSLFIEEGELFLDPAGIYALPLTIDPMVLYYNRDLLSAESVAQPISYWDELYAESLNLTKRDPAGNIIKSTVALGEARNINNFKDILSLLMLQAGTSITSYSSSGLSSQIANKYNFPLVPAEAALDFFTQFSNPSKPYYSWNRSLVEAQTRFTSGDSAYYLGFASELRALRNKNPTLNFAVASVPQSRVSGKVITFGKMRGVAITRTTKDPSSALSAALKLVSQSSEQTLSNILLLPPVRRDLLSDKPADDITATFYSAALQSKGWVDPDSQATRNIFQEMIESVTSGRARTTEAVSKASRGVDALIR